MFDFYQTFKLIFIDSLPVAVTNDVIHLYIGFFFYMFGVWVLKRPLHDFKLLRAPLLVALVMETLDLIYFYEELHIIRWQESLKDVINTVLVPFILIIYFKKRKTT